MSNLTITVDEQVLKQARIRALQEGTSVNAELRHYLETYSGNKKSPSEAVKDIFKLADEHPCSSHGKKWSRDDIYDRWEQHHQ